MLTLTFQFADAVAVSGSGPVDVESNSVTNDASGNVFVTGSLVGTAAFNPSGGSSLSSTGGRDVFLAKYAKTGALVWAKDLRGADSSSVAQGAAIAVDSAGNVLIAGTFTGTVNFDTNGGSTSFSAPGRNDAYAAKYDGNGNLVWARDFAGTSGAIDEAYAVAVEASGNVAVAGSFQGSATFGSRTLTAAGTFDNFVTEISPTGQVLWSAATAGRGSSVAQSSGLAFDGSGNVIATGFFAGTVNFNPAGAGVLLNGAGSRDIFMEKFSPSGALAWAERVGGSDIDQGNAVAADASGNVYLTGLYSGTVNFNPGTGGAANLTSGGYMDGFLLKINPNGQYAWAKGLTAKSVMTSQGTGVGLDGSGHVFVGGYYQGTLTLDPVASGGTLTSAGDFDVFVGEYDTSGNFIAGQDAGGANFDADFGLGVNASGQVAVAGRYTGPASFGTFTLPSQTNRSVFIAQLASSSVVGGPPAPSAPALETGSDSGLSNNDRVTNVTAPVFDMSGVTAPGNLVELLRDGAVVGSRTGAGPVLDPGPVPDGVHVYTARQTDASRNVSPLSGGTSVTFDTKSPTAPPSPVLNSADDSGLKGDGITNVNQPRLTGTIDPNALAQLLDAGGHVVATAAAAADGTFTLIPTAPLADGSYSYRVREESVAGNFSPQSPALALVIDTTAPSVPTSPVLLSADDSGLKGDGITNVTRPRVTGTATAGVTVQLINAAGSVLGSVTAGTDGSYTVSPTAALADAAYALRVQAVDVAGNVSSPSGSLSLTIDTTPPAAPASPTLLASDDSGVKGDAITNVTQPRMVGTVNGGVSVLLVGSGGTILGSATVGTGGAYTVTPANPLTDGNYPLAVEVVDVAGNASAPGPAFSVTIDTTAPSAPTSPTLLAADDSGAKGDGITNVTRPRLTGTATAGVTVQLINAAGSVLGSASAGTDGSYTVSPTAALADAVYALRVQAVDVAGNISAASGSYSLTILTTPPPAPTTPALLASDDSGTLGDGITTVRQPHLIGSSVAGDTVQLIDANSVVLGTATAGQDGSYSVLVANPLSVGTYAIRAEAVDVAGNVGATSAVFNLTIQSSSTSPPAPSAPTLYVGDDTGVSGDGITNVRQPRLVGTAAVGTTVQIVDASGNILRSGPTAQDGTYAVAPSSPLADGTYVLQARVKDASGNFSPLSGEYTLGILATPPLAPSAPALMAADDSGVKGDGITNVKGPRLVGTAPTGTTLKLLTTSGILLGTAATLSDGTYTLLPSTPFSDGTYSLLVRATDVAGNASPDSAVFALTIDTQAPPAPTGPTLLPDDDSGVKGDGLTNVTQPRFTGTSVAGATVQLVSAGVVIGSATVGSNGGYSVQPSSPLADGAYSLVTRTVDVAGNVGAAGPALSISILATPPATPSAPALLPADDTGPLGDGRTAVRLPRLVGQAAPGDAVDLLDPNGIVMASTTTALVTGNYTIQPASVLGFGALPLRVRLRDAAGNVSQAGAAFNLTIVDAAPSDFEGDGKTDMAIFRPANGLWAMARSSGGATAFTQYGGANYYDIPVPADYDGVGHSELAVFRPSTGQWIINGPGGPRVLSFGATNLYDIPVPGDYDGVGYAEPAIYRPSTSQWFVLGPNGGHYLGAFGAPNLFDIPVPGDYDGVGHTEIAIYRPTTAQWFVLGPNGGHLLGAFGATNLYDIPAPGDYDGVGHSEMAIFRPSTAQFFVLGPNGGHLVGSFGVTNLYDIPPQAPVASLRKLVVVGGIHLASFHGAEPRGVPPRSAGQIVAAGSANDGIAAAVPVPQADIVPLSAPSTARKRPAQDVFAAAIEALRPGG